MIRRDYFMRLVQEMTQVLLRVVSLKHRREYEQALREINGALRDLGETDPAGGSERSLEDWIALCRRHDPAGSGLIVAVADLVREEGELFALRNQPMDCHRSRVIALGLFLEALLAGETFVSADLLEKVERLMSETSDGPKPDGLWQRLVRCCEARGRFDQAEDLLFDWLDSDGAAAREAGQAFYNRLASLGDAELAQGGLPRAEVEEGRREFLKASRTGTGTA